MQLQQPLSEYMSLPANQYSVLDAERIERVDEETFWCYVNRFKFFALEVCPVLVVQVGVEYDGSIKLILSRDLPYDKFDTSMTNRTTYSPTQSGVLPSRLTSDAVIKVNIEIPFALRAIPKEAIESTWTQIQDQNKDDAPPLHVAGFHKFRSLQTVFFSPFAVSFILQNMFTACHLNLE